MRVGLFAIAGLAAIGAIACTNRSDAAHQMGPTWVSDAVAPAAGPSDASRDSLASRDSVGTRDSAGSRDSVGGSADAGSEARGGLHGIHSFDVVAAIDNRNAPHVTVQTSSTVTVVVPIPTSQTFTLVLDADDGVAIINSDEFPATTSDGLTFAVHGTFHITVGPSGAAVYYGNAQLTLAGPGGGFTGSAAGSVIPSSGFEVPANMASLGDIALALAPDATPPSVVWSVTGLVDPHFGYDLFMTEPLPPSSVVRMQDAAGHSVTFSPFFATGQNVPTGLAAAIFDPPSNTLLDSGQTYNLVTDGLYDFAGNQVAPFSFTTLPAPQ